MDAPALQSAPQAAPPALVESDLHCVGCRYNLRTRPVAGVCPECGRAIGQSIAHQKRFAGAITEPATLRLAACCFGVPALLPIVVYVAALVFRMLNVGDGLWGGADVSQVGLLLAFGGHVLFMASLLMGVVLLGGSVSNLIAPVGTRVMLAVLAAVYAAINVMAAMGAGLTLLVGRAGAGRPLQVSAAMTVQREQRIGTAMLCLVLALAGYKIMRMLAEVLASERLRTLTHLAFCTTITYAGGTLVTLVAAGAMIPRRNPAQFDRVLGVLDVVSAAVFAGLGVYWLTVASTVKDRTRTMPEILVPTGAPAAPVEKKIADFLGRASA